MHGTCTLYILLSRVSSNSATHTHTRAEQARRAAVVPVSSSKLYPGGGGKGGGYDPVYSRVPCAVSFGFFFFVVIALRPERGAHTGHGTGRRMHDITRVCVYMWAHGDYTQVFTIFAGAETERSAKSVRSAAAGQRAVNWTLCLQRTAKLQRLEDSARSC